MNTTNTNIASDVETKASSVNAKKPAHVAGNYSKYAFEKNMDKMFSFGKKYLGLSVEKADKLAMNLSDELGRAFQVIKHEFQFGKLPNVKKDDGKINVKLVAKHSMTRSNALNIYLLCEDFEELSRYGLHLTETKLAFNETLTEYIDKL